MIRKAKLEDINSIMEIVKEIQIQMKKDNNPQWNNGYPNREVFLKDYNQSQLYVYEDETIIKGFLTIYENQNGSYSMIEENKDISFDLHRLGVDSKYRQQKIASKLMQFAEEKALERNVSLLKADTGANNIPMNQLFQRLGFQFVQTFQYPNSSEGAFNYYKKEIKKEENL